MWVFVCVCHYVLRSPSSSPNLWTVARMFKRKNAINPDLRSSFSTPVPTLVCEGLNSWSYPRWSVTFVYWKKTHATCVEIWKHIKKLDRQWGKQKVAYRMSRCWFRNLSILQPHSHNNYNNNDKKNKLTTITRK